MLRQYITPLVACAFLLVGCSTTAFAQLQLTTQQYQATAQVGGDTVYIFEIQFANDGNGNFTINSFGTVNLFAEYWEAITFMDHTRVKEDGTTFFGPHDLFWFGVSSQRRFITDQPTPTQPGSYLIEISADMNLQNAESAELRVCHTVKGDTDLDGDADFADFLTLSNNYSQSGGWTDGDFDQNGTVDFGDFTALSANFGFGT